MRWLLALIVELTLVSVFALSAQHLGWWSVWPLAILIGIRTHAVAVLGHLAAHRITCLPERLNDFLGRWLAFAMISVDFDRYKKVHWDHHRAVSVCGTDPEVAIVTEFKDRWDRPYKWTDSLRDVTGLNANEMMMIFRDLATVKSAIIPIIVISGLVYFGCPLSAIAIALSAPIGSLFAHRLRARTEHEHLRNPGVTLFQPKPALWKRLVYLPHGTWQHWEHHKQPGVRTSAQP